MALKRKLKVSEAFSMASMTDIIFLLLIFFMVVSTLVVPNAIKVNLPSSQSTAPSDMPMARVTITLEGEDPFVVDETQLLEQLAAAHDVSSDMYVALYADEEVPYREIIKVLNATAQLDIRLVLATKALPSAPQNTLE